MKRGEDQGGANSRCPSSEPRAQVSLLVLGGEGCLGELPPTRRAGWVPHTTPHLGAQGVPGPHPQLVGLGFRHVRPLLGVVQLVLGLAILGQVSVGLLLLGAQAGPLTLWSLKGSAPPEGAGFSGSSPLLHHHCPRPSFPLASTHSRKRGGGEPLLPEVPVCQTWLEGQGACGPFRDRARSHVLPEPLETCLLAGQWGHCPNLHTKATRGNPRPSDGAGLTGCWHPTWLQSAWGQL